MMKAKRQRRGKFRGLKSQTKKERERKASKSKRIDESNVMTEKECYVREKGSIIKVDKKEEEQR